MQLATMIKNPMSCRMCDRKNPKAYLEIEGVVVVVTESKPYPMGGSIFIHRGIFCNMDCFQKYVRSMYDSKIKGKEGKVG